ncbi:hypothetical protein ABPG72_007979 [Tetrahymena utriculariae]
MSANQNGGCIYHNLAVLTLNSTMFYNCQSGLFGGAIFVPVCTIANVTFQNCQSKIGGAIVTIRDFGKDSVTFINNSSLAYTNFYTINQQDEGIFRINTIYQLNRDLKNTSQYLKKNEMIYRAVCDKVDYFLQDYCIKNSKRIFVLNIFRYL